MTEESRRFILITFLTKRSIEYAILPVLIISYLIGWFYQNSDLKMNLFLPENGGGSMQFAEGFILVSIAAMSGALIVFAIKLNLLKIIKIFFSFGLFVSSVSVFWLHAYFIKIYKTGVSNSSGIFWAEIVFSIFGCIVGVVACLVFIFEKGKQFLRNVIILVLGFAIGSIFGIIMHYITFLTLIILISLFDIYSVFRGPISKIFQKTNISITPEKSVFHEKLVAIGIGDFIFYSSVVTFFTRELGLVLGFGSIICLLVGVKVTEKMLLKHGKFPGLPLPVFFTLALIGLGWIVDMYLLTF